MAFWQEACFKLCQILFQNKNVSILLLLIKTKKKNWLPAILLLKGSTEQDCKEQKSSGVSSVLRNNIGSWVIQEAEPQPRQEEGGESSPGGVPGMAKGMAKGTSQFAATQSCSH